MSTAYNYIILPERRIKYYKLVSATHGHHSRGCPAGPFWASTVPVEKLRHVFHLQRLLEEGHDGHFYSGKLSGPCLKTELVEFRGQATVIFEIW